MPTNQKVSMIQKWFVIVNPTSGNGASKKKWPLISKELQIQKFTYEFSFTEYKNHSQFLVQNALKQGFTKIISVGGDGTLHNIVNGILNYNPQNIHELKIAVIPIGTGNDWVKTYNISKHFKKAISQIKNGKTIQQDIGKITLTSNKVFYFNNLAGIGFDGYVVNKVHTFKNLGFLAYLTGALVSLTSFKKPKLKIVFNSTKIEDKTLMLLIGICKFSGGGMQLTKEPNTTDGLFDISYIKNISLFTIIRNITGLFNGSITNHKLVENYKTLSINIEVLGTETTYIQADGELIGSGNFKAEILPKALNFIVPA